jgi:hypothetical protein
VRGEDAVELAAPQVDGLGEVVRPGVRVADGGTADGEDVAQGVGGVLRRAQGVEVGEVEVHPGGGLGARGHLEHDADAVDRELLPGGGDVDRRDDEGGLAPAEVVDVGVGVDHRDDRSRAERVRRGRCGRRGPIRLDRPQRVTIGLRLVRPLTNIAISHSTRS